MNYFEEKHDKYEAFSTLKTFYFYILANTWILNIILQISNIVTLIISAFPHRDFSLNFLYSCTFACHSQQRVMQDRDDNNSLIFRKYEAMKKIYDEAKIIKWCIMMQICKEFSNLHHIWSQHKFMIRVLDTGCTCRKLCLKFASSVSRGS